MYWRLLALVCLMFPLASVGGCGHPSDYADKQQSSLPCCAGGGLRFPPAEQQRVPFGPLPATEQTASSRQSESQGHQSEGQQPGVQPAENQQPNTLKQKPAVDIEIIGGPAFKRVLKKYEGKVVLVDYWATWCGPCVEMFPKTVELHRRLAERGLVVLGVSMDDPDDKPQVAEFLAQHGAIFPNYLSRYGVGAESAEAFGVGVLPTYKLYDRAGQLVKEYSGAAIDTAELAREIEKLLEQP